MSSHTVETACAAGVLVVDNDSDVAGLVTDVLRDEGFEVSCLADTHSAAVQHEVDCLELDAVLLGSGDRLSYGESWSTAAWLHGRQPRIPVIMFSGHSADLTEAVQHQSERSRNAAFVGFVGKPFDLTVLVDVVNHAAQMAPVSLRAKTDSFSPARTTFPRQPLLRS